MPWRRKWQPSPVFLPGESHGQRSLGGYVHRSQEWDTAELGPHTGGPRQQHPLFLLRWVWGLGGCRCVSGSDSLYPEHSVRTNLVDVRGQRPRACLCEAAAVCSVPPRSLVGTDGVPRVCPSRHLLPGDSRGIKTDCHIAPSAVDFRGTDGSGSSRLPSLAVSCR